MLARRAGKPVIGSRRPKRGGTRRENLRVVNRGFKEGLIGHTEVLDAQTMRTQAQNNLANARYDAILATYHLQRAVGQL